MAPTDNTLTPKAKANLAAAAELYLESLKAADPDGYTAIIAQAAAAKQQIQAQGGKPTVESIWLQTMAGVSTDAVGLDIDEPLISPEDIARWEAALREQLVAGDWIDRLLQTALVAVTVAAK